MARHVVALALLLALGLVTSGVPRGASASTDEFTDELARRLLPEAASMDRRALDAAIALGEKITPRSVAPSLPLLVMLAFKRNTWPPGIHAELGDTPSLAPRDLAPALRGVAGARGSDRPTLLHPAYVRLVTFEQDGDEARGVVTFEAKGVYEGRVHYEAKRTNEGWRITAFEFPVRGARLAREDGAWKLVRLDPLGPLTDLAHALGVQKLASREHLVSVYVLEDGVVSLGGDLLPLSSDTTPEGDAHRMLVKRLRERADAVGREPSRTSRLTLAIVSDGQARWLWTTRILTACASAGIDRIGLVARSSTSNEVGVLRVDLPDDAALATSAGPNAGDSKVRISLFRRGARSGLWGGFTRVRVDRGTAFEFPAAWAGRERAQDREPYDRILRQLGDLVRGRAEVARRASPDARVAGEIATPPPLGLGVPYEDAVQMIGLLREAGIQDVRIEDPDRPLPLLEDEEISDTTSIEDDGVTEPEPVLKDEPLSDHVETDDDLPFDEALGDEGLEDVPFEGPPGGGRLGPDDADPRAAKAVEEALRWLAVHQSPDGGWEAEGFGRWCEGQPASEGPDGRGRKLYDVGVTGLALCAYLGAGHTNRGQHPFAKVISRGLRYLKNVQDEEGCYGPRSHQHYVYCHAAATLAMVEAYGMTESPFFKRSAQRALDFIALARNPHRAWRYGVRPGDNDTSITTWMACVLRSARLINEDAVRRSRPAPLKIDAAAFDGIRTWIGEMTDPATGRVGYSQRGGQPARSMDLIDRFPGSLSESMTAAGMLARVIVDAGAPPSLTVLKGAELCLAKRPAWTPKRGNVDMYYWYWASLALFQVGGETWSSWNRALTSAVLTGQRKDTTYCLYKGSWDPVGPWGPDGGRVYATALLAMCLEASYRYPR